MINWDDVDTILLDMDGTLLDLNYDHYFWTEHLPASYAKKYGNGIEEARNKIYQMITSLEGTLNWYCLEYWSDELGMDVPSLKSEIAHLINERPHSLDFLQWLKQQGKTNILVTNSHSAGVELKFKHSKIADYLDHVFTSHQFNEPKESISFWEKFHQHHPFELERSVLIDDNEHVLTAARKFGVAHLLTIQQPNMAHPPRQSDLFPSIACYSALCNWESTGHNNEEE